MWRCVTAIGAVLALACAAPASAQSPYPGQGEPYAPWDGSNPFNCTIQNVGTGVDFPDPDADPFCVEFDKTQQNVSEFGIFEFLSNEPARVAAAGPKCFYYQTDHWTGSVVQGTDPELWHWDGQYFFDKAIGVGGVNVRDFRVLGQPASPSDYGEVPPEFEPYMDQGGGGSYLIGDVEADPACAARVDTPEEQAQIYVAGPPPRPPTGEPPGETPEVTIVKPAPRNKCKKRRHGAHKSARKRCHKRKRYH
jgi:hypothetical protein